MDKHHREPSTAHVLKRNNSEELTLLNPNILSSSIRKNKYDSIDTTIELERPGKPGE